MDIAYAREGGSDIDCDIFECGYLLLERFSNKVMVTK
jgi:hypothetical protein